MIKTILWDVDGTLLDFQAAERAAMEEGLAELDLFGGEKSPSAVTVANENAQALDAPFSFAPDGSRVESGLNAQQAPQGMQYSSPAV